MSSDNWSQIKEILDAAIRKDPNERAGFLDEACNGNETVRREVESLLSSFDRADGFLDRPILDSSEDATEELAFVPVGQIIGHYEIIRMIGEGGMGIVYLARDKSLDRLVAIKLLNKRYERHEENVRRFIREAKAASALNHPNILTIYEVAEFEGAQYIVSEYVEGRTLREVLAAEKLTMGNVADLAAQIAGALAAAHKARIIHRDIKPENIVVREDGYVKVLDFGLAKLLPQQTSALGLDGKSTKRNETAKGVILGTVNYMSPEQARGESVDERTDIFSLGTVIYEMVTGKTPFSGNSYPETFANLIHKDPAPMSDLAATTPAELQRIVMKMLRKEPADRYQTMNELYSELKELREQVSGRPAYPSTLEHINQTAVLKLSTRETDLGLVDTAANGRWYRRPMWLSAAALLVLGVIATVYLYIIRTPAKTIGSVAVLPFASSTADADTDFLADGITDNIIERLSELPGLKVTSHSAVFHYKGEATDPHTIGTELGVETVLTGRLVKRSDGLTISFELVNIKDNSHIWGDQYDRKLSDLLSLQREIAVDVANQLRPRLTGEVQQRLTREYTSNTEAYQLYLKGRYSWEKWSNDGSRQALAFFKEALAKDPNYALAYAGIADAYLFGPGVGPDVPSKESLRLGREAATKALSLDPQLGEAHAALAEVLWFDDWDFSGADREFKQAITLSPSFAEGHHEYSHFLLNLGRINESRVETDRFIELDPVSEAPMGHLAYHYLYARQYDEAIQAYQKTIRLYPQTDPNNHVQLANAYYQKGMFREAVDEYIKGFAEAGTSGKESNDLRNSFARSGVKGFLEEYIALAKAKPEDDQDRAGIGEMYARLGEKDHAFEWLEKAFAHHDDSLVRLKEELGYDDLRSDPRFADLLRRVGLPQ